MTGLTIGKVARESGLGIETIRFYEREKLIAAPPRSDSGYRQYPENTITRIHFIKRSKALGFTLREIRELLALSEDIKSDCEIFKDIALEKMEEIEQKIRYLKRMRNALKKLSVACPGNVSHRQCPILNALTDSR